MTETTYGTSTLGAPEVTLGVVVKGRDTLPVAKHGFENDSEMPWKKTLNYSIQPFWICLLPANHLSDIFLRHCERKHSYQDLGLGFNNKDASQMQDYLLPLLFNLWITFSMINITQKYITVYIMEGFLLFLVLRCLTLIVHQSHRMQGEGGKRGRHPQEHLLTVTAHLPSRCCQEAPCTG